MAAERDQVETVLSLLDDLRRALEAADYAAAYNQAAVILSLTMALAADAEVAEPR